MCYNAPYNATPLILLRILALRLPLFDIVCCLILRGFPESTKTNLCNIHVHKTLNNGTSQKFEFVFYKLESSFKVEES